jgi:hypothetical protein
LPYFQYKAFERETGGPCWGIPDQNYSFEAPNEDVARHAAYIRVEELPPGCFAVLQDVAGRQIWTGDARDEPHPLVILTD